MREKICTSILTIDITSFYSGPTLSCPNGPGLLTKTSAETISFCQNGDVTLFGIGVSSVQVICEKLVVKMEIIHRRISACRRHAVPFDGFSGLTIPGLSGIQVVDGHFLALQWTDQLVYYHCSNPDKRKLHNCLPQQGKLMLQGSSFLELIHSIIKISEIDINILPGLVDIAIPPGSGGLSILNVFIVKSFDLQIMADGFGLGADVELDCDWLSKDRQLKQTLYFLLRTTGHLGNFDRNYDGHYRTIPSARNHSLKQRWASRLYGSQGKLKSLNLFPLMQGLLFLKLALILSRPGENLTLLSAWKKD